jgi:hypothetical protein
MHEGAYAASCAPASPRRLIAEKTVTGEKSRAVYTNK